MAKVKYIALAWFGSQVVLQPTIQLLTIVTPRWEASLYAALAPVVLAAGMGTVAFALSKLETE